MFVPGGRAGILGLCTMTLARSWDYQDHLPPGDFQASSQILRMVRTSQGAESQFWGQNSRAHLRVLFVYLFVFHFVRFLGSQRAGGSLCGIRDQPP